MVSNHFSGRRPPSGAFLGSLPATRSGKQLPLAWQRSLRSVKGVTRPKGQDAIHLPIADNRIDHRMSIATEGLATAERKIIQEAPRKVVTAIPRCTRIAGDVVPGIFNGEAFGDRSSVVPLVASACP